MWLPTPEVGSLSTYTQAAREYWEAEIADRAALVDGNAVITYADWSLRGNQLADGLESLAPAAQRVCVVTGTRVEWFVANLALAKLQWEQVSVDRRAATVDLCAAITTSGASIVITDIDDVAGLRAGLADPGVHVISLGDTPTGTIGFASLQTDPRPTSGSLAAAPGSSLSRLARPVSPKRCARSLGMPPPSGGSG